MKISLISHVLPPTWSGQAIMLYRLLKDLDPDDYCLISHEGRQIEASQNTYTHKLGGTFYHLPAGFRITRGSRFRLGYFREPINAVLGIVQWGRRIAEIARREKCDAIVACTGELLDLPAGFVASRMVGIPFFPYIFDYYGQQFPAPEKRFVARRLEPILMRGAAGVIVTNEILRDELRSRYGIESTVIHNPCDISEYEALPTEFPARENDEIRIVYTGAVYEAHFDAFRNLIKAIDSLGQKNLKLHLYTAQSPSELAERGIRGPVVFHEHQAAAAMPGIQRQADILFLPLAFNSPYPALVRTSATSKLAEYLAARRPVLVHAPPDSFVSWYFQKHECGVVVPQNDPSKLAHGIHQILSDPVLRTRLSANAWQQASSDFSASKARALFVGLIESAVRDARRREQSSVTIV